MSDQLRLLLGESHLRAHGTLLSEKREALGLSIDHVADRLLLSRNQVRGLENDSAAAFYNQRFFERARDRYAALLHASRARHRRTEAAQVRLTMTFAGSPAPGVSVSTGGPTQ